MLGSASEDLRQGDVVLVSCMNKSKLYDLEFAEYMALKQASESLEPQNR